MLKEKCQLGIVFGTIELRGQLKPESATICVKTCTEGEAEVDLVQLVTHCTRMSALVHTGVCMPARHVIHRGSHLQRTWVPSYTHTYVCTCRYTGHALGHTHEHL